jgi:ABC-type phosphate transport system auxiliary subunit
MPLRDEITELLRMPEDGAGAPSLDAIETTLTDGYAEALALDAERSRIERRLGEVVKDAGEVSAHSIAAELAELSERLEATDQELTRLRTLLHSLQVVRRRRRAGAREAGASLAE